MTALGYARWLQRRAGLVTVVLLALGVVGGWATSRLELRTDLAELLPEGSPSVRDLRRLQARTTGVARLTVAVEWTGPGRGDAAVRRALAALVPPLRARLQSGRAGAELDEGPGEVRAFFERQALLYLEVADLEELAAAAERARRRTDDLVRQKNPLFIDLDGPAGAGEARARAALEQSRRELETLAGRLRRRLEARAAELGARLKLEPDRVGAAGAAGQDRYLDEDGRLGVLLLRPSVALDASRARAFLDEVQGAVREAGVERISPHLRVTLTGGLAQGVIEYEAFRQDIVSTAGLCVALVALAVWLYFRRLRVLWLLTVTLLVGAALCFGLARLSIGYLNGPVAFLSSVIVGTGINYGILLLARLREERERLTGGAATDPLTALQQALATTWQPTLVAALTTAVSFGALYAGHVLSFRHFGLVGGAGILICWALSYTLLPALWVLAERRRPEMRPRGSMALAAARPEGTETRVRRAPRYPFFLARWPARWPKLILTVGLVITAGAAVVTWRHLPDALEGDLDRLRTRSATRGPAARLEARAQKMLGTPELPSVLLARDGAQAVRLCAALEAKRRAAGPRAATGRCRTLADLVPADQPAKLVRLRRVRAALDVLERRSGDAQAAREAARLRRLLVDRPFSTTDLPEAIRRPFTEKDGRLGTLVLVEPPAGGLWQVERLRRFTSAIRHVELGGGESVTSSGEAVVFADLLDNIAIDAPRTSALALALVLAMVLFTLRRASSTLLIGAALLVGVVTMTGAAFLLGLKINFFNFVALPTTFGIGVDYLVNILGRHTLEVERVKQGLADPDGPRPIERVLWTTGGAVVLCSATTVIGYATLLVADNRALASFGALAALGELTCLAAALLLLPAALHLLTRRP